jgi:hypothetical protein
MLYAFHPEKACWRRGTAADEPADQIDRWESRPNACGRRRYLLPGLAGNIQGHWDYRKEWFFYGGGAAAWNKGWAEYTGVELPLCYWEKEFQRLLRTRPLDDTVASSRQLCTSMAEPSPRPTPRGRRRRPPATAAAPRRVSDRARRAAKRDAGRHSRGGSRDASAASGEVAAGAPCMHRACLSLDLQHVKFGPQHRDQCAGHALD